jgi:hypothetical protein
VEKEMNEQIKKLAEQAGAVFVNSNGLNDCPQDSLVGDEIQKFAELIVLACSEVIRNDGYRSGPFGNQDLSPSEIAIMIEEHFGIKS